MKLDLDLSRKIHDIHPAGWKSVLNPKYLDYVPFRNLTHFKNYLSKLVLKNDSKCGVTYTQALDDLLKNRSQLDPGEYESIRNTVRMNLLKRGLISEDIYESYKYDVEGIAVDVSKVIEGNPECMLKPAYAYTNYFYELYISVSYPYHVTDATIRTNMCKLLATIEELERQHIYIKITAVFGVNSPAPNRDLLVVLPVFSHKDFKSIEIMSAVFNERLLRKFMFALEEDIYGDRLYPSYGRAVDLPQTIKPVNLDECELFAEIYNKVITKGVR